MLAYIMVGTNNVKRAAKFYDAALAPLLLASPLILICRQTFSAGRCLGRFGNGA